MDTAYQRAKQGSVALHRVQGEFTFEAIRASALDGDLRRASTELAAAHHKLTNPALWPLRFVPILGRQLRSAVALTGTGSLVSGVGADTVSQVRLLNLTSQQNRPQALRDLSTIAMDANQRVDNLQFGPSQALFNPLVRARAEEMQDTERLRSSLTQAIAAAQAAAALLDGPSRFLVLAANQAEMRAGAGMFLSAGTLDTDHGSLKLGDMQTVGNITVPANGVTVPPQLTKLWGWLTPEVDFRNLMLSPSFDESAPLAAKMWEAAGKGHVDGVLVLDPDTLKALLAATGPVQVNDQQISSSSVVHDLLFDQYKGPVTTKAAQKIRRDGLSDVAQAVFDALDRGSWDPVSLGKQLATSASGRHLLVWSPDEKLNHLWQAAGVSGRLDASSLMVNSVNVGGNKLDQFLDIHSQVNVVTGTSGLDTAITVEVTNNSPTTGPGYVLGPFPGSGLKIGEYQGVLAVSVPGDSAGVRFDGNPALTGNELDGTTHVIATEYRLEAGQSHTFVLRYTRPAVAQFTTVQASGRQPPTRWSYGTVNWTDDHAQVIIH